MSVTGDECMCKRCTIMRLQVISGTYYTKLLRNCVQMYIVLHIYKHAEKLGMCYYIYLAASHNCFSESKLAKS